MEKIEAPFTSPMAGVYKLLMNVEEGSLDSLDDSLRISLDGHLRSLADVQLQELSVIFEYILN